MPATVAVGSCSPPITFEVRNGTAVTGVPASTPVTLAATPAGTLGLFRGSGCSLAQPLTLAPDASFGSFSFFAGDGGTFSLALSGPGLLAASQQATTTWPAVASLAFTTAAQTVRAGDCSAAVTVELRDGTNAPAKANTALALALSALPAPGVLFHTDALCASAAVSQVTVPFGASRATFYVARATGQPYTLTATLGALTASRLHTILPVVRSGTCVVGDADGGALCPVSPAVLSLADSFLVYQVESRSDVAGAAAVLCELDGVSNISCRRGQTDLDAVITWQVAEVKGSTVRRVSTVCDGGLSIPLGSAAPPGSSFVLTANENDGTTINDSDFNIARLNDAGTAVDFSFGGPCTGPQSMLAQVVTLPGITVVRGTSSLPSGMTLRSFNDPPTPQAGVLFAQWGAPSGTAGICDRAIRAELNANSINFSRANGSSTAFCTTLGVAPIQYEKVDFRTTASVQQVNTTLGVGNLSTTLTLGAAVDRTRTLVFTGGQGSSGQGLGEGTHVGNSNSSDFIGEVALSFSLPGTATQATQLAARRGSMLGASRWTVWVVELIP